MFTFLTILILLSCILLSLVVLAQSSKGDGLAGGLGAPGSIGTVFGVRRASDFLMKATIALAATFMVLSMIANIFFLPSRGESASPLQGGGAVVPPASQPVPSGPAVQNPPGGQPGTGVTSPDQNPPAPRAR